MAKARSTDEGGLRGTFEEEACAAEEPAPSADAGAATPWSYIVGSDWRRAAYPSLARSSCVRSEPAPRVNGSVTSTVLGGAAPCAAEEPAQAAGDGARRANTAGSNA